MNQLNHSEPEACVCKLTSPELTKRKHTVIASLKKKVLESKESDHGFAYKFDGYDIVIDELCEFIKTERQCCDFFSFSLSVGKEPGFIWLELTGPRGAKEFIKTELEF